MKKSRNELARIESIIKTERLNVKDDFSDLLIGDLDKVLKDYFDYKGLPILSIDKTRDAYQVKISLSATAVHSFTSIPAQEVKF